MYSMRQEDIEQIIELYKQGNSSQEIKDELKLPQTVRSIQRRLAKLGLIRNRKDSFLLAIKKGRVLYQKNPQKKLPRRLHIKTTTRLEILRDFNYRCVYCGNTSNDSRLQIDHIDEDASNNKKENLQILCEPCNKGKAQLFGKVGTGAISGTS
jgi:hypothetical protein